MNAKEFYYRQMNRAQQDFYRKMEEKIVQGETFPYRIRSPIDEKDVYEACMALYLDRCSLAGMPPPHLMDFLYHRGDVVVTVSQRAKGYMKENENFSTLTHYDQMFDKIEISCDPQQREFLSKVVWTLYEHSVYHMTNNGKGEAPNDIFNGHSGYCTGFARTVKYICEKKNIPVICVRGKLKRHVSAFVRQEDEPHMFNAIYDERKGQWFFFDPTASINVAPRKIRNELQERFYRTSYKGLRGDFRSLQFYDWGTIQREYILEKEERFCT